MNKKYIKKKKKREVQGFCEWISAQEPEGKKKELEGYLWQPVLTWTWAFRFRGVWDKGKNTQEDLL